MLLQQQHVVVLTQLETCRHGDKHTPSIIRMGMNAHHTVASVSMENLVQRRLEATKDTRVCHPVTTQCSTTQLFRSDQFIP